MSAACPEPEGTKKLSAVWTANIAPAPTVGPAPESVPASAFRTGSTVCPSSSTTRMPRARPISAAVGARSRRPSIIARAVPLAPNPPTAPISIPSAMNSAPISTMYQPNCVTPTTRATRPRAKMPSTASCRDVRVPPASASACCVASARRRASSAPVGLRAGTRRTRRACRITNATATVVTTTHSPIRKPIPLNGATPAMPCATPTVNGLRKAAAKPACEPTNGIATPVTVS